MKGGGGMTHPVQGFSTRLTSDFSSDSSEATGAWGRIFRVLREKKLCKEFYAEQNYLSAAKEKPRAAQRNRGWAGSLAAGAWPCRV